MSEKTAERLYKGAILLFAFTQAVSPWAVRYLDSRSANKGVVASSIDTHFVAWVILSLIGATAIVVFGTLILSRTSQTTLTAVENIPTFLELSFGAPNTIPVLRSQSNIWRWYVLRNFCISIEAKTKKEIRLCTCMLFIAFDRPVSFRQILIDGSGLQLPSHEVKDSSPRTAIILFGDDLVGITVNVRTH